jgi:hypothetical protein
VILFDCEPVTAGMSSEIGKAGLLKATLEMIREKRSGSQPELFQVAIFALSRMCLLGECVVQSAAKRVASVMTAPGPVYCRTERHLVPQTLW